MGSIRPLWQASRAKLCGAKIGDPLNRWNEDEMCRADDDTSSAKEQVGEDLVAPGRPALNGLRICIVALVL